MPRNVSVQIDGIIESMKRIGSYRKFDGTYLHNSMISWSRRNISVQIDDIVEAMKFIGTNRWYRWVNVTHICRNRWYCRDNRTNLYQLTISWRWHDISIETDDIVNKTLHTCRIRFVENVSILIDDIVNVEEYICKHDVLGFYFSDVSDDLTKYKC